MKKSKIVIISLFILLFSILPLAAEDSENWYVGKTITAIETSGLVNVKDSTVNSIVKKYVGETFTDELYYELDSDFYSQSWLSYMLVYADEDENNADGVILEIEIYENPKITSITFEGNSRIGTQTLTSQQTLSKGGYYSSNNLSSNALLLQEHYVSKGYKDATVEGTITEDSQTNTVAITYVINEGKQYKVRAVSFEGNNSLTTKELKALLATKEKSFFNSGNYLESNLTTDELTLKNYYSTKGYPECRISEVRTDEITEDETDRTRYLSIVFVIDEGDLWKIGNVSIEGSEIFTTELSDLITIQSGDTYNSDKINSLFTSISTLFYDNGYVYSNIDVKENENPDTHTVDVVFTVSEGPQTVVEEIRINGLEKTKPYVLEREIDMTVGDVFSRTQFVQAQQNMYNTSLLKNITANLYPGTTENGVICEFNVEEGNTMELQFGATFGANEIDGFPVSGFLSLSNTNLFGTGRSLSVSTELSPTTQAVSLSLSNDWVGDKRWSNAISFSIARNVRSSTLQRGIGSDYYDGRDSSSSTYPLGYNSAYEWYNSSQTTPSSSNLMKYNNWSFTVGYSSGYSWVIGQKGTLSLSGGLSIGLNRAFYDKDKYDPYELLIKKYGDRWQFSNKMTFTISWDARNYVSRTPHGYVASLSYTYAGGVLQGLSNYNKLSLSLSAYTGVLRIENKEKETAKNIILGVSSEVDFMLPQYWNKTGSGWQWYDAKDGATKYEMLYIDGMNIGRGFSVQTDKAFLWNNQIDLTYPLAEDVISLEGFVSGTAVTTRLNDLSFNALDWYFAAGFGLKMEIPGFPLGLYLVKNATILSGSSFAIQKGSLFNWGGNSGLSLVLAITTSIY